MTEKVTYHNLIDQLKQSEKDIGIRNTSKPNLTTVSLTQDLINLKVYDCFVFTKNRTSIKLCFLQYEHHLHFTRSPGTLARVDVSFYTLGIIKTKRVYPHTIIQPESYADKLHDLLFNSDIKFPNQNEFNSKYYLSTENKDNLIDSFAIDTMNYLCNFEEVYLELRGNNCFFRLDKKSIEYNQVIGYLKFGFGLCDLL
ncbi:MAG: hypothetical protein IPL21_13810 [Saprospirales bacterium]|nr:hypothetical protein [Saprospirales bacterium]